LQTISEMPILFPVCLSQFLEICVGGWFIDEEVRILYDA
jgi:hypothetical protein